MAGFNASLKCFSYCFISAIKAGYMVVRKLIGTQYHPYCFIPIYFILFFSLMVMDPGACKAGTLSHTNRRAVHVQPQGRVDDERAVMI